MSCRKEIRIREGKALVTGDYIKPMVGGTLLSRIARQECRAYHAFMRY